MSQVINDSVSVSTNGNTISNIQLRNNTYEICDKKARSEVSDLKSLVNSLYNRVVTLERIVCNKGKNDSWVVIYGE